MACVGQYRAMEGSRVQCMACVGQYRAVECSAWQYRSMCGLVQGSGGLCMACVGQYRAVHSSRVQCMSTGRESWLYIRCSIVS